MYAFITPQQPAGFELLFSFIGAIIGYHVLITIIYRQHKFKIFRCKQIMIWLLLGLFLFTDVTHKYLYFILVNLQVFFFFFFSVGLVGILNKS